jgi:uncharacterized membrane protein YphA (DoxX/SURF4 family)
VDTYTETRQPDTRVIERPGGDQRDPTYQAYLILRVGFVAAPVLFGLDKFFNWMTAWPKYLWSGIPDLLNMSPQSFMYAVGAIEVVAGVMVLLVPRFAPYVVAGWLAAIITNLGIYSIAEPSEPYWDIALRDLGLMLGALALARLAAVYAANPFRRR